MAMFWYYMGDVATEAEMFWRKLKKIVGLIDNKYLGDRIRKFYDYSPIVKFIADNLNEPMLRRYRRAYYGSGFDGEYRKNDSTYINRLCDKYGSDKGGIKPKGNPSYPLPSHNYADIYDLLFRLHKNGVRLVVECGIAGGGSLRVWRDYFPKAQIIGFDVEEDQLFSENRIVTFQCDQTSTEEIAAFTDKAELKEKSVDIIIDDGLHQFHAGITLFTAMNKYMAENGIYIIEDIMPEDYKAYKDYFAEQSGFEVKFINLRRPKLRIWLNRLIIITRS